MLLSVIIVGQNVLAAADDSRAEATYNDADAVIHEVVKVQEHLLAHDALLARLLAKVEQWCARPARSQKEPPLKPVIA